MASYSRCADRRRHAGGVVVGFNPALSSQSCFSRSSPHMLLRCRRFSSRLVNVVASGVLDAGETDTDVLGTKFSVEKTAMPGRVYLKPDEMPVPMVFRSGSYTIAGPSFWESSLEVVEWLFETLDDIGVEVDREAMLDSFSVKYLVVTGELGSELNLSAVVVALGMERSEYEPEQFPAVIHKPVYQPP